MDDELDLRNSAWVPNSKNAKCPLCEEKMYPKTILHHCGTTNSEVRVDQIKCVHCSKVVVLIKNQILNIHLNNDLGEFCRCYNDIEYQSSWVTEETLKSFSNSSLQKNS